MYITWTVGLTWLLLASLAHMATAQTTLPTSYTVGITAAQHRNPEYVAPATKPILVRRDSQLAAPHTQVSRNRVGWLRRLLGRLHNLNDVYATPVIYGLSYSPLPVSTTNDPIGPFRNQRYSTGWPGPNPLRTKWLFGRSGPIIELFSSSHP